MLGVEPRRSWWRTALGPAIGLVVLVFVAYLPVERAGFVWDDHDHVVDNLTLRDTGGLARIWLDPTATPQYYPLVHTTFWLEYRLVGASPHLYHLDNVILHAVNALLVWRLMLLLSVPGAWLIAAVFALHPVQVESVAWISERKNVLSTLFYLASALAYLRFARVADVSRAHWRWYGASWLLYLAALLAKTVTASLPAALALVLWWRRGRLVARDFATLAPMLVVGAGFGLMTAWLERAHVGASGPAWDLDAIERVLIAGRALWFYLYKLAVPFGISFVYPRWTIDAAMPAQYLFPAAFVVLVLGLYIARARIGRGPVVAMLFFAGTVFPALGFIDVYPMRYSFVANHFQYVASIGPVALGVVLVRHGLVHAALAPMVGRAVAAALVVGLVALTWRDGRAYESTESLWRDTLGKNRDAWLAHNNLGIDLDRQGRHHEAAPHYVTALRLRPDYARAHYNLARNLVVRDRLEEALHHFETATGLAPGVWQYQATLGEAYLRAGDFEAAERAIRVVLGAATASVHLRVMMAAALVGQGRAEEAREQLEQAIRIDPGAAAARTMLGEIEAASEQARGRHRPADQ